MPAGKRPELYAEVGEAISRSSERVRGEGHYRPAEGNKLLLWGGRDVLHRKDYGDDTTGRLDAGQEVHVPDNGAVRWTS